VAGTGRYVAETGFTKVQKSRVVTRILELNGVNSITEWPVILGGRCIEDTVKNAKDGRRGSDLVHATVLKRVMVL